MNYKSNIYRARFAIFLKWLSYSLILFLLYILQTTPGFFQIFGIKPVFIIPFAVTVVMFEGEFSGAVFAGIAGLLWDMSSGRLFGFFGFFALLLCCLCGLFVIYLIKQNLVNTIIMSAIILTLLFLLDFYFNFVIWGYEKTYILLLTRILPSIIYSAVFVPLYYFIVSKIHSKTEKALNN